MIAYVLFQLYSLLLRTKQVNYKIMTLTSGGITDPTHPEQGKWFIGRHIISVTLGDCALHESQVEEVVINDGNN